MIMKQLDVYYRALLEYREQTQQNKDCVSDSRAVMKANPDQDKIVLTRKHCIVEEDWVDTIEEGLKYIAKAIAEERQFIHSQGETVPIEKVKNVSKDSVVHLAKHSNLITREIPGQDVIPDQLYTVEKLSDYAVYENKFLYMLLCYLRDFITIRYNKILELSNTYNGTMTMNKVVKTASRTMKYSVNFAEEKRDDDYLKETNQAKEIINRIDLLLKTVIAFFSTPLMQFVSKAPMIKPPITKTNVLKMNNNFKQALNLYGYVVAYDGDGYRVETEIKEISPYTEDIAQEMSETILLSSFITYEHSLGIESYLKREYELEEQRRKEKAIQEFREKIEAARLRVQKSEMPMEEYILMLEKHIRTLEKKAKELDKVKKELEETKNILEQTKTENEELKTNLENTINELEAEKLRYVTDMAALKLAHEEEIKNLVTEYEDKIAEIIKEHEEEIRELNEEHERQIHILNDEHEREINLLNEQHEREITQLNDKHEKEITAKNNEITSLNNKIASDKAKYEAEILRMKTDYTEKITTLTAKNKDLSTKLDTETRERRFLKAQLLTLKKETGKLTSEDDHITQLKFDDLQHTFETFKEYYKLEWKKAKRHIRRTILSQIFKRKKKGAEPESTETTNNGAQAPIKTQAPTTASQAQTKPVPTSNQTVAEKQAPVSNQAIAEKQAPIVDQAVIEKQAPVIDQKAATQPDATLNSTAPSEQPATQPLATPNNTDGESKKDAIETTDSKVENAVANAPTSSDNIN